MTEEWTPQDLLERLADWVSATEEDLRLDTELTAAEVTALLATLQARNHVIRSAADDDQWEVSEAGYADLEEGA